MQFDPNNNVVKLCSQGMNLEGEGKPEEAYKMFQQAWNEASNDFEKFTSAHYVARHQKSMSDKLKWDKIALNLALKIDDETMKGNYPSLYLNIGKCYEDLNDLANAVKNYELAHSFIKFLPKDGYGKMIKGGIINGIERIKSLKPENKINDIETYIQKFPDSVQIILRNIRKLIKNNAPDGEELIAYGMPAYKTNNKPLIYFAAFKHHIGIYAISSVYSEFKDELSKFKQGKGSVQFPLDRPMPYELIERIVNYRVIQNNKKTNKQT